VGIHLTFGQIRPASLKAVTADPLVTLVWQPGKGHYCSKLRLCDQRPPLILFGHERQLVGQYSTQLPQKMQTPTSIE